MEYNYYVYDKPECNLLINKMPIWFKEVKYEGDQSEGTILLHSQNDYDEIWGSDAKMEIFWEKMDPASLFYAKEIQKSIDIYSRIGLVITSKEDSYLMSHNVTFWFGRRAKMIRKRYYNEKSIHAIFYCDNTNRLINIHCAIIDSVYENFKPFILKCYNNIVCH
ncbi:MAG: hypothetical protein ACFFBH_01850 [Promethearchaeota archaeon]